MGLRSWLIITVVLITIPAIAGLGTAQSQPDCNEFRHVETCITDVSFSDSDIEEGDSLTIVVTVQNVGNETGDAVLIAGTEEPDGEYTYSFSKEIKAIEPGEVQDVELTGPIQNEGAYGKHFINFMLFDSSQQHLYDATGFQKPLIIRENTINLNPLKWLQGLHYTIQIGLGILTILGLLVGKKSLN